MVCRSAFWRTGCPSLALLLLAAACAGRPTAERERPAVAQRPPSASSAVWDQKVKIGNPYEVAGTWYYPSDDRSYDQVGIASWYGPGFHGQSTANGEWYDQNGISAAHKTLPLPSYVEVTNLKSGKHMVVRINDRGPFVGDRLIDLSRRTAELLDVQREGTAPVRVRRVHPTAEQIASLQPHVPRQPIPVSPPPGAVMLAAAPVAARAPSGQAPAAMPPASGTPPVAVAAVTPAEQADPTLSAVQAVAIPASSIGPQAAATPRPPVPAQIAPPATPAGGRTPPAAATYIQVAAVTDAGRASWLAGYLRQFGASVIERTPAGLHRVRLGPYPTRDAALAALAQVRLAGYEEAWVVGGTPGVPVS